jgi:UDP-N-acetylglucosamine:LPS N-acetylglucosamine transferase
MDMAALGKKAVFIPTPGQPEQEYLARRLKKQGLFYTVSQTDFNLEKAFREVDRYRGLDVQNDYTILDQRLDALIESITS